MEGKTVGGSETTSSDVGSKRRVVAEKPHQPFITMRYSTDIILCRTFTTVPLDVYNLFNIPIL
jgi:hypothetical protein